MFIKKIPLILSTVSLFAFNAQAIEGSKTTHTNTKMTQLAKKEDKDLKAFNQNIGITLIQRGIATEENQPVVVLIYEVQNKGKNQIKNANWVSAFTVNNQVFHTQEIKTNLNDAIMPNKQKNITVTLPLDKLPENAKQVFAKNEIPVGHLTIAKQIDFTDGKKIVVKE